MQPSDACATPGQPTIGATSATSDTQPTRALRLPQRAAVECSNVITNKK